MTTHTPLLIIGTGFAGIGLAMKLKRNGDNDFIIIERSDDVGGTWRDNRYPGAACDVPSHLYSYSFKLKSDWSRVFAPATEIWEYMRWCAQDEGLMPHIHFNTNMLDCSWDETSKLWRVSTSQGEYTANVVVTATNWANFYGLRRHADADPTIKALADAMWDAQQASTPTVLARHDWHLPYITDWDRETLSTQQLLIASAARCARVSYNKHDGSSPSFEDDLALYQKLVTAELRP